MASEALGRPSVGGAAKRRERTMDGNFRIGRFGGVEVRINWSLLAIFALIVWSLADGVFPSQNPGLSYGTYLAMAIVTALLFFASILLHELGHSWEARREGMEVDAITSGCSAACRSSRVGSRAPVPSSELPYPARSSQLAWASCSC